MRSEEVKETYCLEAAKAAGEFTFTAIAPGFNLSKSRYYPAEVLRRDHTVFKGVKMFGDHATPTQERERPEGSVHDWIGHVKEIWAEPDGRIRGKGVLIDPRVREKVKNLAEHGLLGELGISIRAIAEAHEAEVQGHRTTVIERLVKARSLDLVTYAGAGGKVELAESATGRGFPRVDLKESFKSLGLSDREAEIAAYGSPQLMDSWQEYFLQLGYSKELAAATAQKARQGR
jgi:hypothetical protein